MHHTDEVSRFQVEAVIIHRNISKYHESLLDEIEVEKLDEIAIICENTCDLVIDSRNRQVWDSVASSKKDASFISQKLESMNIIFRIFVVKVGVGD